MDIHIPDVFNETPNTLRRAAEVLLMFADQAEHVKRPVLDLDIPVRPVTQAPPPPVPAAEVPPVPWPHPSTVPVLPGAEPWPFPPPIGAAPGPFPPVPPTVPAPPAAIPAPPAAVPAPPAADTKLDAQGLPWDGRIPASTKTFTANGNWKYKKGVAPELIATVEKQWRDVAALPTQGATSPPPLPVAAAAPIPPVTSMPETAIATSATISPSEAAPVVPAGPPTTFADVVMRVARLQAAGKITREQVEAALSTIGIPSLALIGARADLIPQAWAMIEQMVPA